MLLITCREQIQHRTLVRRRQLCHSFLDKALRKTTTRSSESTQIRPRTHKRAYLNIRQRRC
ncbi:hypothetical protein BC940DRAFT_30452 [Gongronella butleri]|nr:hypothetical protein BC940DRAFT_30452 [Gongronella butleri]